MPMEGCGGMYGEEVQHHFRPERSEAGTYIEGHKLSYSLHPTSALSEIIPCFLSLPHSSNKIFSHEFGPLLAPTQADRGPACHPFPQPHLAWPSQPTVSSMWSYAPIPGAGTTLHSLLGFGRDVHRVQETREAKMGQQSFHLNTGILCNPPCWQVASIDPNRKMNH